LLEFTSKEIRMSSKLKIKDVAYFSSEHTKNSVKNLICGAGYWTTPSNSKLDILEAEFCLTYPSSITGIDVGNFWSASVEVYVGLSEWPQNKRETLLPEHVFMNRIDCSVGENKQKMMFFREKNFSKDIVSKKWDRVKVVCKQPFKFNNDVFGLGMFVMHGKCAEVFENLCSTEKVKKEAAIGTRHVSLDEFKKKAENLSTTSKRKNVPSVLKSLENQRRQVDSQSESSNASKYFNESALSRTGKLIVQAQAQTGKEPTNFEKEAAAFLRLCHFDKMNFAELENLTFRRVKELWFEKNKYELVKEDKDTLKKLSSQYINKLVSRSHKRRIDDESENMPIKKRKVSDHLENMRKNVDIVDQVDEQSIPMRNRIATMDIDQKTSDQEVETDTDILQLRKKFNYKQPKVKNNESIPIKISNSKTDKIKSISKSVKGISNENGWVGKSGTPVKSDIPSFNLDWSPDAATVLSPPKPTVTKPITIPINYNRKHLLSVSRDTLIASGILVQVYNYKKDKKLPLKGNTELSVIQGEAVTFYKVGPDIHLEYGGRFYLPAIQDEHLNRVFKNFAPKDVQRTTFPPNLVQLLNTGASEGQKIGCHSKSPQSSPSKASLQKIEADNDSCGENGECPMCLENFPLSKLSNHASECQGASSESKLDSTSERSGVCPICQLEMEANILEDHAVRCAASMFGS